MGWYRSAYAGAVLLAGLGSVAATFAYPGSELALLTFGHMLLAVLTFPLGSIASATGLALVYTGFATLAETTVAITPLHAVLGYLQWCRLVPAFYRSGR